MKLENHLQDFARTSKVKFDGNHSERFADFEAVT